MRGLDRIKEFYQFLNSMLKQLKTLDQNFKDLFKNYVFEIILTIGLLMSN